MALFRVRSKNHGGAALPPLMASAVVAIVMLSVPFLTHRPEPAPMPASRASSTTSLAEPRLFAITSPLSSRLPQLAHLWRATCDAMAPRPPWRAATPADAAALCGPAGPYAVAGALAAWGAPSLAAEPPPPPPPADPSAGASEGTPSLLVFLPGTGSAPADYRRLVRAAARAGHHALALTYASSPVAVADANAFCAATASPPRCNYAGHAAVSFARRPRHLALSALAGRVLASLAEAHAALWAPPPQLAVDRLIARVVREAGWAERFLDGRGALRWERAVLAGHSQGGGHAAFVAAHRARARAVLLSAPQDEHAAWLDVAADRHRGAWVAVYHVREECGDNPAEAGPHRRPGLLARNAARLGLSGVCALPRGAMAPEAARELARRLREGECQVVTVPFAPTCANTRRFHISVAKDECAPREMDVVWEAVFHSLREE